MSVLFLACTREAVCGDLTTTYETLFNDHVDISIDGYTSGSNVSSNFTLLVRLSESRPSGFLYDRVDSSGADLRFIYHCQTNGVDAEIAVPHEVDEWNSSGTSFVWVRLPTLNNNGANRLTMYWAPDDATALPANDARQVWSDCIGVWHLNSTSDSSPNALPGWFGSKAITGTGVIGAARGTRSPGANGPILTVPYQAAMDDIDDGYTITTWVRLDSVIGETPYLYSRRQDSETDALAAQFVDYVGKAKLKLLCNKTDSLLSTSDKAMPTNTWSHLAVSVAAGGSRHTIYLDGIEIFDSETSHPDKTGTLGLAVGGLLGSSDAGTLNGYLDEFRVFKKALPQAWVKQDYAQATETDYIRYGTVSSTGKPVYQNKKKSGDDPTPGGGDVSPADYVGTAVLTPDALPEGQTLTNFVMEVKVWQGDPAGFVPSELPFGTDDIRFFDEQGNVLNYEVDTWDVNGESFFWVKLPKLTTSTRVTMCWALREGRTLPANDPYAVWSDYAGVWHMSDASDSTTNNAAGSFGPNIVTTPLGVTGKAVGRLVSGANDPLVEVVPSPAIDALTNAPFTVTGWAYLNTTNVRSGALFSRATTDDPAWGAQFCGPSSGDSSRLAVAAGDGSVVTSGVSVAAGVWTRFDVVYATNSVAVYINGVQKISSPQTRTILNGSSDRLTFGGLLAAVEGDLGPYSLNGYIDEFRLMKGVQLDDVRTAEYDQGSNEGYFTRHPSTWDSSATIQNRWLVYPTVSKTEWNEDDDPAEVTPGVPWYSVCSVSYMDRLTGEILTEMPTAGGDYRVIFYCPPVEQYSTRTNHYSALTYTVDFRIRLYRPTHDLGDENDRILLLNDDDSVSGGEVWDQSYGATAPIYNRPYWEHDVDSGLDYTSTSLYYNFCGGMRHTYWSRDGATRLWDLIDVRYGNTYNNADNVFTETGTWEEWDDGLQPGMNYLPWNPAGYCLVDLSGMPADGWHEFAAQAVMCNTESASINSTLYTNGIGTIYFDAVNSHTDDATNGCYKLVVEFATNAVNRETGIPYGIPTDENIEATHEEWSESEGRYVTVVHNPYKFADWKRLTMHVRVVNGETMTDLGTTDELTLDLAGGGSYTNFYRVYVPVDCLETARFRILRTAVNSDYTEIVDTHSLILVDNVICSKPTDRVRIEPRGTYDKTKVMRETVGYEGAFKPSFPSIEDDLVYARAKATTVLTGQTPPAGMVSSVSIHYRWRYLDQQTTEWLSSDIDPLTMIGMYPLDLPGAAGDIEYWYEANQSGEFYQYADYSGLDIGLDGYTELISCVTNRAETYATKGKDWYTRIRDGKSTCSTIKLYVRRGEDEPVETVQMFVARDQVWRGCLLTTNAVEGGVYYRFEARDRQDDSLDEFQFNTNYWYSVDEADKLPISGTVRIGGTNDWGVVPCDAATGHILFQLDDTTRALVVVHADWQDFNAWNDADRTYFSGTSTDDSQKKGTSVSRREYPCDCGQWTTDVATNEHWIETFTPTEGAWDQWVARLYKPFVSDYTPNGFDAGYGMFVRGAYADTSTLSGFALQIAGQGQGHVELTDPFVEPRGLESVKLNARIAQSVSPDDFAYFEDGARLNDYTFLTRAAFDLGGNSNFTGNASLSLAAFYRAKHSCYEARWEQIAGHIEDESGTILGPAPRGQRLVLYRWKFSGNEWHATELYAATNSGSVYSWKQTLSPTAIPAAFSITNGLMPFALGAYNDSTKDETLLIAAILIPGTADPVQNVKGIKASDTISDLNSQQGWLYLVYRDTSDDRLTRGTYGVLAANCEGVFVHPQVHDKIASWKSLADTKNLTTQCYPDSSVSSLTGMKIQFTVGNVSDCVVDIRDDFWIVPDGRMEAFDSETDNYYNGFESAPVSQTVNIYTAPIGTTSWSDTPVGSKTITGFGKPGVLHDTVFNFWSTDDVSVQVKSGGYWDQGVRTDLVVDNIVISQWRGKDWSDPYNIYTNFAFTSGWVTNGALQLSPRRTPDGYPCSIRTPLCDGKGASKAVRGLGLGHLSFEYRNAQANARVMIQIATNNVSTLNFDDLTVDPGTDPSNWTTITNFDFSAMTESERASGILSCSPGIHGVKGMMRIIIDPTLRDEVKDGTDPDLFGSIEILQVLFRDEPPLDKGCWWGFNLRTLGEIYDNEQRMYLPDNPYRSLSPKLSEIGRSLALNNSITEDCDPTEIVKSPNPYREHMPFLQTPTFSSNIVGEVSFKARKYTHLKGAQCAEVTLYGAQTVDVDTLADKDWQILNIFVVSNSTYETYRFKVDSSTGYRAFRLAVTGVDGVLYPGPDPICGDEPVRVLIDDVLVSEAVRARLAFRNVGAFRSDIAKTTYVPNVPSAEEQPIVGEAWGVQAEVYPAMLGEEIDSTQPPRVKLYWYTGLSPWGYQNWKDRAAVQSGWLSPASDTNMIYRSSTMDSPDAVIPMATKANTVVQYMLEVIYTIINTETGGRSIATNWLEDVDWKAPSWYSPVDYNASSKYGKGLSDNFAAFTILDDIAPGWAWINEANVLGTLNKSTNPDADKQFVEIAKPSECSLKGWKVKMLGYKGGSSSTPESAVITTNTIATFGTGNVSSDKSKDHEADNMTFMVVGCPASEDVTLFRSSSDDAKDETLDGTWTFSTTDNTLFKSGGTLGYYAPFGIQLVRPSGAVEHEVVLMGTNKYEYSAFMRERYDPTNLVNRLNAVGSPGGFFYVGADERGGVKSLGVFDSRGESSCYWNSTMTMTPGRINENQHIDPDHPTPSGEMILIFASVDTVFGHIRQTVGTVTNGTATQTVSIKKGSESGLNIKYSVDPWYELGTVKETEKGTARVPIITTGPGRREYTVNVAKGAEKNVTVLTSAQVDSRLREFGLDENNRYTPAVLHWLEGGKTCYGDFYDNDSCEVYLAKFLGLSGTVTNDMTLTQMYWLDMDPTAGEMYFRAGMVRPPSTEVWKDPRYDADNDPQTYTNLRMGVYMSISNGNGHAEKDGESVWAPYVLRGLAPGELSWGRTNDTTYAWTSVTFKVTGFLNNGLNDVKNEEDWVPLRYFVFDTFSFDSNMQTEIDIVDPFSRGSLGYRYGWYDWAQKYGKPLVFFSWNIDQRLVPVAAEVLYPTNRLHEADSP